MQHWTECDQKDMAQILHIKQPTCFHDTAVIMVTLSHLVNLNVMKSKNAINRTCSNLDLLERRSVELYVKCREMWAWNTACEYSVCMAEGDAVSVTSLCVMFLPTPVWKFLSFWFWLQRVAWAGCERMMIVNDKASLLSYVRAPFGVLSGLVALGTKERCYNATHSELRSPSPVGVCARWYFGAWQHLCLCDSEHSLPSNHVYIWLHIITLMRSFQQGLCV